MTTISPVPEQDFIDASIGLAIRAALPSHRHLFCLASGPQGERGFVCTRMHSHAGNHECIRPKTADNSAIVLARWK